MSASNDPLGCLCIVLHGHLPYVLNHGTYPHGEAWLYEAAAETYLPILDLVGEVALLDSKPALTVGLTPVLLEQLSHERFKAGFVAYLKDRAGRAAQDRKEFGHKGQAHFAQLAERWEGWYAGKLEHFERIGRDIPGQFAQRCREGHIQILTGNATHAYMPLLLNDESARAQMACGTAASRQRLGGLRPRGMWLPECAYRPASAQWKPAVLYDDPRGRAGVEEIVADAGVTHFFVDTHQIADGEPLATYEKGRFRDIVESGLHWDSKRGWRSPLEPVGVVSGAQPPRCFAFARHPRASEQVWSGAIGYPGSGEYLEFHRKHGDRGLRYHRVTDTQLGLADKQPYAPEAVSAKVHEHAQHFCSIVREVLGGHKYHTNRQGVCVAPFDAELFGHWWFEGPQFLRDVILTFNHDPQVKLTTAEQALDRVMPDKVMRLKEGSWGENGDHGVWLNDKTRWMWEMEYRAENRMLKLLHELPWRQHAPVREMIERAGRELLLLQASDWPFVVHSKGAVDYGTQRFALHCTRFDRMTVIAEHVAAGGAVSPLQDIQVREADAHDSVFPEIDLDWWMPRRADAPEVSASV